MNAFVELIDSFGSIVISGDAKTVEEINADIDDFNTAKGLTDKEAAKHVKLEKNQIILSGKQALAYLRGAGDNKANAANTVLSQLTKSIFDKGFGGMKSALDMALDETTVYVVRDDAGALIQIGTSVLGSIEARPVGNMEGRQVLPGGGMYTCDYQAERAALIKALY